MLVSKKDGACVHCQGQLLISDADDISLSGKCVECGERFKVETDAFNDGGSFYWPNMMMENAFLGLDYEDEDEDEEGYPKEDDRSIFDIIDNY